MDVLRQALADLFDEVTGIRKDLRSGDYTIAQTLLINRIMEIVDKHLGCDAATIAERMSQLEIELENAKHDAVMFQIVAVNAKPRFGLLNRR